MKYKLYVLLIVGTFFFPSSIQASASFKEKELFVKFKGTTYSNTTSLEEFPPVFQQILQQHSVRHFEKTFLYLKAEELNNTYTFSFLTETDAVQAMKALSAIAAVEYAERVPVYGTSMVPNDPLMAQQWYIGPAYINAFTAWNIAQGNNAIKLAIVDDEVKLTHQDLAPNLWVNPAEIAGNGVDDDNNGYIDDVNGWDAGDNDNNPNPPVSATNSFFTHGTHCAGIADAKTNNSLGIASIGDGARLMAVKCNQDNNTGSYLDNALGGVQYAIAARADVVSMSWGGGSASQTYQNLFNYGHSLGITFVAAAGNNNSSQTFYPAGYNHVISVAASDQGDVKAGFSNYGAWIDITAPGANILSCLAGSNSSYGNMSGTSMACPMVAGLCALIKSHTPALTPDQIEQCLKAGAENIDAANPNFIGQLGSGRINAFNALMCAPCLANASFAVVPQQLSNYLTGSNLTFTATGTGTTHKWFLNNVYQSAGVSFNYTFNTPGYKTVMQVSLNPDSLCTDTVSMSFTIVDSITTICKPMYGANWFFGTNCKVSFLTVPPSTSTGPMNTYEGSSTISDECGNLLFFTDGSRIWDKTNAAMPNGSGLLGNSSSTQGAAIVRNPGYSNLYYSFSVDYNVGSNGLRYSIVDLSLPGNGTVLNPLGNVTVKNVLLNANCTEKVTATRHGNGTDYWVVTHNSTNNDFYAYLVTATGVSLTPVVSTINDNFNIAMTSGQLKFSPNGDKLAAALFNSVVAYNFKTYNFDRWTGQFTSDLTFAVNPVSNGGAYGVEFSPDASKLYMTTVQNQPQLVQYDFTTGIQTTLVNEVKCPTAPYGLGVLQLAPDGKIYVARQYCSALGVIHNPNAAAPNCNYCESTCGGFFGLNLAAGTRSNLGVPSFVTVENPAQNFSFTDTCVNQLTKFYGTDYQLCSTENKFAWNFGDIQSGSGNVSALRTPSHQFTHSGNYTVSMTISNACDTVTVSKQLQIVCCNAPDNLTARVKLCLNDTTQLSVTPSNGLITWSPTAGLSSSTISNPLCFTPISRKYFVQINDTSIGCSHIDTVYVDVNPQQPVTITEGKNGCTQDTLRVNGNFGSIVWSNGVTGKTNLISTDGLYSVLTTDINGCTGKDTVDVQLSGVAFSTNVFHTTCGNNNGKAGVNPITGTSPFTYNWSTGLHTDSISNLAAGIYTVTVIDNNGCSSTAAVQINSSVITSTTVTSDKAIMCAGDSAHVCAPVGFVSYLWNTGQTDSCIYVNHAGNYYVTATDGNNCQAVSNHLPVDVFPLPSISVSVNDNVLTAFNGLSYQWYLNNGLIPNATQNIYVANQSGSYTVAITDTNGCRVLSNSVSIVTGINDLQKDEYLNVYPNPLESGSWTLECKTDLIGSNVEIFDNNGRLIYTSEIRTKKAEINLLEEGGIYLMRITSKQGVLVRKLIKL